jgi:hypothetical protein
MGKYFARYSQGKISADELHEIEGLACPGPGGQIVILELCSHPRGEHTEEGTAERAGEGSKAG